MPRGPFCLNRHLAAMTDRAFDELSEEKQGYLLATENVANGLHLGRESNYSAAWWQFFAPVFVSPPAVIDLNTADPLIDRLDRRDLYFNDRRLDLSDLSPPHSASRNGICRLCQKPR